MADEKKEEAAEGGAAPASKKWILVGITGAFLLGGGVAAFFSGVFAGEPKSEEQEELVEEVNEVFQMDPFVINLSDSGEMHYLRLGVGFGLFNPNPGTPVLDGEILLPRLKDFLLISIGQKTVSEVAGPNGREKLKEDILEGANSQLLASGSGKILEVYLTEFVIQ